MKKSQIDHDALITQARSDPAALGDLYEIYYPLIYRFCTYRLFCKHAAEDVTSTVFLRLANSFDQFKGNTDRQFRSWIYTIAANQANAYLRTRSRRKQIFDKVAASLAMKNTTPHHDPPAKWAKVYKAIADLRENEQTFITLRYFQGLTYDQIADIHSLKPASVRVTVHRSIKKLRQRLTAPAEGGINND